MTPSVTEVEAPATAALDAAGVSGNADGDSSSTTIWSSILQSVSSSKMVFTKNVLVLGDPNSGKSALIQNLKRDHKEYLHPPNATSVSVGTSVGTNTTTTLNMNSTQDTTTKDKSELALSYNYSDVKDDENEDTIGRLGFYQLSASHPTLLRFAFNAHTFADTLIIITVDWQRPWTFVETLERWFSVIRDGVQSVRDEGKDPSVNWSKGGVIVDEGKERLERFLQEYVEPSEDGTLPPNIGASNNNEVLLPLSEGLLTTNFGIPVVVVCCKADNMNILEKEHDYKEDQFDFIQQTLRTICSYYGAGLFYTSTHRPKTFALLRAYLLSRLMYSTNSSNANALMSARFSFPYRAQVVDRDIIMIPAGWDSWGKIQILRDGFDCRQMADAWEMDEASPQRDEEHGLHGIYQTQVRDMTAAIKSVVVKEPEEAEDEQEFLAKHIEVLRRVPASGATAPTASNISPSSSIGASTAITANGAAPSIGNGSAATSPVLSSSSLNRSNVAAAVAATAAATAGGASGTGTGGDTSTDVSPANSTGHAGRSGESIANSKSEYLAHLTQIAQSRHGGGGVAAAAAAASTGAGAGVAGASAAGVSPASQNEVLASFFKSLLDKKGARGGAGAATTTSAGSSTSSSSARKTQPRPADES